MVNVVGHPVEPGPAVHTDAPLPLVERLAESPRPADPVTGARSAPSLKRQPNNYIRSNEG